MQCSKCGYQMHGKETTCVCCGRVHSSYSEPLFPPVVAQRTCGSCGRVQNASNQRCPSCGVNPSFQGSSLRPASSGVGQRGVTLVVAAVVLAVLVLGLSAWGISAQRQEAAQEAQARAARKERLAATLASLRAARPAAFFDRYPGDNNSVPFQARLTTCDVRGLTFSRTDGSDTLTVNVTLLGYKANHQSPLVNVALYGEDGTLLAEKAIVEFTRAELEQGETREVEDTMDYPKSGIPVFAGVNEGSADVAPVSAAPQPPASPATNPSAASLASGESYQEAMEDFKYACSQQGYAVIWPHDGDEDVVGILVDDGALGAWSAEDKNALSKALAGNFAQTRQRGGRTGPYKAIVRFVPSGYVVTATPNSGG